MPYKHTQTSKSISGFDPRSIGGCQAWLDASDIKTLYQNNNIFSLTPVTATGQNVQCWGDKSGYGRFFTIYAGASGSNRCKYQTTGSFNGVYISNTLGSPVYNSSTYCALRCSSNYQTTPNFTIAVVINFPNTNNLYSIYTCQRTSAYSSLYPQWEVIGSFTIGNAGSSTIATSRWSTGDYNGAFETLPPSNTPVLMMLTCGRRNNTTYINGVASISYGNSNAPAWPSTSNTGFAPTIGGCTLGDNRWATGAFFEVLYYDSELTTAQRQQVEGYLAKKWNLQSSLPTIHPFYSREPMSRTFTPVDIPKCVLWLDAADPTTMTGSSSVTQWRDKSANNYVFTVGFAAQTAAMNAPGLGRPYPNNLFFDATCWAYCGSMNIAPPYTVFAAACQIGASSGDYTRILNGTNATYKDGLLFLGHYSNIAAAFTGNGANWNSVAAMVPSVTTLNTWTILSAIVSNTTCTPFANGSNENVVVGSYGAGTLTGLNVGGGASTTSNIGSQPFWGNLGEVIIYSGVLPNSQREAVEGYLAYRWGITAMATTTTAILVPYVTPSAVEMFAPTNINGCCLWLDAMTTAVGAVTTWTDKSGYGSNATAVGSISNVANAINGRQAISFTGGTNTGYFTGNIGLRGTTMSVFVAATSSGGGNRIFSFATAGSGDYNSNAWGFFGQYGSGQPSFFRAGWGTAGGWLIGSNTIASNIPFVAGGYFDGINVNIYVNGSNALVAAVTTRLSVSNYAIGKDDQSIDPAVYSGYIGELLVYNCAVTAEQRQQIEGYLARKWGIIS